MAPNMLHPVDVSHQSFGQVGQIPLAEISQGQLPQPFCQTQTGGFHLPVHKAISSFVLLEMR